MNSSGFQVQLFAQAPNAPVNWRLLSGNNRESGRGATGFRDVERCTLAVVALQVDLARLRSRLRRVEPNHWIWELHDDGTPHAVAGHRFDRSIRCEQAMAQFVAEFGRAPIRAGVVLSGARRWDRAS